MTRFFLQSLILACSFSALLPSTFAMDVPMDYQNPEAHLQAEPTTVRFVNSNLQNQGSVSFCTGSWISHRSLLSAGHCDNIFSNNPEDTIFVQLFPSGESLEFKAHQFQFVPHPLFKKTKTVKIQHAEYDLAVITIDKNTSIPDHAVATFAPADLVELQGQIYFSGAGGFNLKKIWKNLDDEQTLVLETQMGRKVSSFSNDEIDGLQVLMALARPLYTFGANQASRYSQDLPVLVTNVPSPLEICKGDSGGPLFKMTEDSVLVQIGVHSQAELSSKDSNCGPKAYDTFLDSFKLVWISETMSALEQRETFAGVDVYGSHWVSFKMDSGVVIDGLKVGDAPVK